jgi:integrase
LAQFKDDRRSGSHPFTKAAMVGTINKELTLATTILNKAARVWRWIPISPKIELLQGARRVAYPLTWDEQARLFSSLPRGWDVGCAVFAVNTGVRKAELFGLKWSDMVPIPELETFVFVLQQTKNGEQRAVICNSLARRAVGYQRGNGSKYVFPSRSPSNKGGKMSVQSGKVWLRAWEKAGLPSDPMIKKGIHNLRHTFAHRLRAAGVPQEDRNALLGHARTNLAEHYAMPDIERLSKAAEKVTERKDTVVLRAVQSA